jgi:hypothetical protein
MLTRRTYRMALASLAILTAVTLTACQGGTKTAEPPPSPVQPAPANRPVATTSKPAIAQPTTRPAASSATTSSGTDFGFIRSWTAKTGTIYLRFDRAVLLTGKAADDASAAHGGESPVPNDYFIQNDNPRLREVVILDQAKVIGSQQLTGSPGPNPSSLKALLTFVHNGGPQVAATPFHLKYNDNGFVTRVQEQYLP